MDAPTTHQQRCIHRLGKSMVSLWTHQLFYRNAKKNNIIKIEIREYEFKIETVHVRWQLLEFHARSDHQNNYLVTKAWLRSVKTSNFTCAELDKSIWCMWNATSKSIRSDTNELNASSVASSTDPVEDAIWYKFGNNWCGLHGYCLQRSCNRCLNTRLYPELIYEFWVVVFLACAECSFSIVIQSDLGGETLSLPRTNWNRPGIMIPAADQRDRGEKSSKSHSILRKEIERM